MKRLGLSQQGSFYYAIGAYNEVRLRVEPGEKVVLETEDAFSGQIRTGRDRRDLAKMPYANPMTGPIYVEGAGKGDALTVDIMEIKPLIGQGATRIPSWWWYQGGLGYGSMNEFLGVSLPHGTRICPIKDGKVYFSERFILPYEPMIGTIGTAPELEAISTFLPSNHGGNMDLAEVCVGSRLYLPVWVEGALLHVGDIHAVQGDGEICGTAIEMPSETTLTIGLAKGLKLEWPRIESRDYIMTVTTSGPGRTLEEAIRVAYTELVLWLEKGYSIDRWEAYQLCTQIARLRLGNIWTVAAKFPKRYLRVP